MISEFDLSPSSEPSSPSHSQESQRRKCKYQGKVSTCIIFKQCKHIVELIQNTEIIEQYSQLLGLLNLWLPVFSSKFHPNPKIKTTQVSLEALMARIKRKEAEIKNGGAQPRN